MALSVQIGLLLAVATALTSIIGFLYKHRGAVESPRIDPRRPVRSSLALFRSRWYLLGIAVALGSWGMHVGALALAPISLVQSVIAGGLVLLTVVANRLFGLSIMRREWVGVALTAIGLTFLAATMEGVDGSAHSGWAVPTLALYIGVAGGLGVAAAVAARSMAASGGTLLAASAGLIWGASDVSIKALSDRVDTGLAVLVHPLALVILVASLVGLSISARSLQVGRAVPVIAVTSATANVVTIASGSIVFGEPIPDGGGALALRLTAFALVIVAAALTPPPVERGAAEGERGPQPA